MATNDWSGVHPQAIVDPSAKLADNVTVGPWSYIGPGVEIGEGTEILSHVVIKGPTVIGRNNRISSSPVSAKNARTRNTLVS